MRYLIALALAFTVATSVTPAYAAPVEQACNADAIRQDDMAGSYVSVEYRMRVEIYPCGGVFVRWDNQYGAHAAAYGTTQRIRLGGIVATVLPNTGAPLDNSRRIAVQAAEPEYVQVITMDVGDSMYQIYRLKKIF